MKEREDISKENEDNAIKSKQKDVDESASSKKNGGFFNWKKKTEKKEQEAKKPERIRTKNKAVDWRKNYSSKN